MCRIRLIHWKSDEAEEGMHRLRAEGYEVDASPLSRPGLLALRAEPPDAVIIDLSRAPSQGRDLGLTLRTYAGSRRIPLVYAGGATEKVAAIRELLPDAVYTTWEAIGQAVAQAIAEAPEEPVVPKSVFAPYKDTPLTRKLGIKAGTKVALVGAPEGFEATLGELPKGATVQTFAGSDVEITLWFVRSRTELEAGIRGIGVNAEGGGLWIVWPKKASGVRSDLSQAVVRKVGLDSGLVDFKVCSLDETWSGLRFSQKSGCWMKVQVRPSLARSRLCLLAALEFRLSTGSSG